MYHEGGDTSLKGVWGEWGRQVNVILTLSPHMAQAAEEDEKGTAGGLLSSLEGSKMRPSLLMTRYLVLQCSWCNFPLNGQDFGLFTVTSKRRE